LWFLSLGFFGRFGRSGIGRGGIPFFALGRGRSAHCRSHKRTHVVLDSPEGPKRRRRKKKKEHGHEKGHTGNHFTLRLRRKWTHRLKCLSDSPGWISIAPVDGSFPFPFAANILLFFVPAAASVRRFLVGGGFDVLISSLASSSTRNRVRFSRYSARILAASNTRATDLGMRSVLIPLLPPDGARSAPLGK